MRLFLRISLVVLALGTVAAAQRPTINSNGVVNGASYAPVGLPNSAIARGSVFVIFGDNLGPSQLVQVSSWPLPTGEGLAGTSVRINTGSQVAPAILLYTSKTQVAAILPSRVPEGSASISVRFNGQDSNEQNITVVKTNFGIFARNNAGSGPAILQNFYSPNDQPLNSIAESAQPGQTVSLWGTGLGPVSGDEAAGALPGDHPEYAVEVSVGGQRVQPTYRGRSGCCAGLDQIAFSVPVNLGEGACYVPVVVKVDGKVSNFTSISVARRRGACSDPLSLSGFTADALQKGLSQGAIVLSRVGLSLPISSTVSNTDTASGSFSKLDFARLVRSRGIAGISTIGSCSVFTFAGSGGADAAFKDVVRPDPLDAGVLTLSGPKGQRALDRKSDGSYAAQLGAGTGASGYLDQGQYTVTASGGRDVGQFSATLTIPSLLFPLDFETLSAIPRTQPLTVSWQMGSGTDDLAYIAGVSTTDQPQAVGAAFTCIANASDQTFTVPAEVLSLLPPSAVQQGVPTGLLLLMEIPPLGRARFTAPGLDAGWFYYTMSRGKNVSFQ